MRVQTPSVVAAVAASVAASPAAVFEAAAQQTIMSVDNTTGIWVGSRWWSNSIPVDWASPTEPGPNGYILSWVSWDLTAYDNAIPDRPVFFVTCQGIDDNRNDTVPPWIPCLGYTPGSTVEAQYLGLSINIRQNYTVNGQEKVVVGLGSHPAYPPGRFPFSYAAVETV
ncbi:hypothetical protein ANO14919_053680 [Xylariales sp. No.14919]|nr:hypothetical protein ANO14919_053680 [Xylariales sp. No.14919]